MRGADWAKPLRQCLARAPSDIVAWMEQHTQLLKCDAHSRVGLLHVQEQPCILKLYLGKSPLQRVGFRLGFGRGIRSFDAAVELRQRGLPVPAPRTCLLVPAGMLLLSEAIVGSRDLRALWIAQPSPGQAVQYMLCAGVTLAALHSAGFSHGDCKWSNLLWNGEQFYLVDLDAVRAVKPDKAARRPLHARQLRDLARYTIDAEEMGLGPELYGIFLQHYCARAGLDKALLVARIRPAAEVIRQRHKRRDGRDYETLA